MQFSKLSDAFISLSSAALMRRSNVFSCQRLLPKDLYKLFNIYHSGHFIWLGEKFVLCNNPFNYNLNVYVSLRDIYPYRAEAEAFHRYDDCYVLFTFIFEGREGDEPLPNIYLGVDLRESNFGWIFMYSPGEYDAQLANNATYVAESWSDFMQLVIDGRLEFNGASFWSRQNRVLTDEDLEGFYVPDLPLAR